MIANEMLDFFLKLSKQYSKTGEGENTVFYRSSEAKPEKFSMQTLKSKSTEYFKEFEDALSISSMYPYDWEESQTHSIPTEDGACLYFLIELTDEDGEEYVRPITANQIEKFLKSLMLNEGFWLQWTQRILEYEYTEYLTPEDYERPDYSRIYVTFEEKILAIKRDLEKIQSDARSKSARL